MRLKSIRLTRFKAFEQPAECEFGKLTVLIGKNNAGKSSILHALALLAQWASPDPSSRWAPVGTGRLVDLGPIQSLTNSSPRTIQGAGWEINVQWESPPDEHVQGNFVRGYPLGLEFEVICKSDRDFQTQFRAEPSNGPERYKARTRFASTGGGVGAIEISSQVDPIPLAVEWQGPMRGWFANVVPSLDRESASFGDPDVVRSYVAGEMSPFINGGLADALSRYSYVGADRHVAASRYPFGDAAVDNPRTASELLDTLAYRKGDLLAAVSDRCLKLFGYGVDFDFEAPKTIGLVAIHGHERHNVVNVGSGLTQTVWILTHLELAASWKTFSDSDPRLLLPKVVGVEEPELHLHPGLQPDVAAALVDYANSGLQIICSTQSEHFLMSVLTLVLEGKLPADDLRVWFVENGSLEALPVDSMGRISGGLRGFFEANEEQLERQVKLLRQRA